MRVQDARPKGPSIESAEKEVPIEEAVKSRKVLRRSKDKPKEKDGVIPGFELDQGRKVQRGWTDSSKSSKKTKASKKAGDTEENRSKRKPSKFTNGPECLFRTKLPLNANIPQISSNNEGIIRKRKRGKSGCDAVIHEFSNTIKHASFLKDRKDLAGKKSVSEYIEGTGWMDEDGVVVEAESKSRVAGSNSSKSQISEQNITFAGSNTSGNYQIPTIPSIQVSICTRNITDPALNNDTSSSGTSLGSESDSEDNNASNASKKASSVVSANRFGDDVSQAKSSMDSDISDTDTVANLAKDIHIGQKSCVKSSRSQPVQRTTPDIHPLEALFKRPKVAASSTPQKPALEVSTSFSFFDQDAEDRISTSNIVPHTPFTQQDIRERRQRSAAPTPDTAAPGKTFGDAWSARSDSAGDEESGKELKSGSAIEKTDESVPESDFSKWFWEHRGETNRAWKRRRREAAKEKRKKDKNSERISNEDGS